eukprot:CAMPEP_0202893462 /NCGR_PEP_ID=MMETSP1392-20130828/3049_1 /ASSEMBLY_ACC=CAM_ASM_000868 /TAXON_ID=225041 /ORGANISM="Chlamydomonas chlamydogama, Strain SAG 11-48b" /LENGTH=34 /DNA_ID= /DNA_START= /DNA_END= /DNA_ORIENTATION=
MIHGSWAAAHDAALGTSGVILRCIATFHTLTPRP